MVSFLMFEVMSSIYYVEEMDLIGLLIVWVNVVEYPASME